MKFKDLLNNYLSKTNCSSKELSLESGLSQSVISRYRSGERIPNIESKQLNELASAISIIASKNGIDLKKKEILNSFITSINKDEFDYDNFSKNFNELIRTLKISIVDMSKYISFDPSYISRIHTGQRKPAYPDEFVNKVCSFITNKYNTDEYIKILSTNLNCSIKDLKEDYFNKLRGWLTNNSNQGNNNINKFLKDLNDFDLNNYIKVIKFDELKIPNIPFYKPKNKTYYGIEEMKSGELDFFKATVLSKSKEPIFMCSDMPIEDLAKDIDFGKKWMFAIAMSLKKGLHLNIIHDINRPFNEMMLGLESWIPIYMTGQISPYYLKNNKNNVYNHFNYVSGSVALTGEAINGFHNKGKYYLTHNKTEVDYYKTKAQFLLKKANSLMDIYNDKDTFSSFFNNYEKTSGNRHRILSSLPLFTIDDDLLTKILKRNNVSIKDIKTIINYKNKELKIMNTILKNNTIYDEIPAYNNSSLSLENMFYDKKITYTHEEYNKHLECTKNFKNSNYSISINDVNIFNNIRITMVDNNFVIISKKEKPIIHFVIKHPKLRNAIENFSVPIKEN